MLINLKFHSGIVNQIALEKKEPDSESDIKVYSVSEDGYLACWELQVWKKKFTIIFFF